MMSTGEFIGYLRTVESANPGSRWQQIVTKLHQHWYAYDTNIVIGGVPLGLFQNGPANEGWERVSLHAPPPKLIMCRGQQVNIAHAYAGVRAGINRSAIPAWIMRRVNTGWGDSVQVWNEWILGTTQAVGGSLQWWVSSEAGSREIDRGLKTIRNAGAMKPPDQVAGNQIGLLVACLLDERFDTLSDAFASVLP